MISVLLLLFFYTAVINVTLIVPSKRIDVCVWCWIACLTQSSWYPFCLLHRMRARWRKSALLIMSKRALRKQTHGSLSSAKCWARALLARFVQLLRYEENYWKLFISLNIVTLVSIRNGGDLCRCSLSRRSLDPMQDNSTPWKCLRKPRWKVCFATIECTHGLRKFKCINNVCL